MGLDPALSERLERARSGIYARLRPLGFLHPLAIRLRRELEELDKLERAAARATAGGDDLRKSASILVDAPEARRIEREARDRAAHAAADGRGRIAIGKATEPRARQV
jgi:hypothetical protein